MTSPDVTTSTSETRFPTSRPVLVVGASGKTGRRVSARLADVGVPVRQASRRGRTVFDWDDARTWAEAIAGSQAVYLTVAPDLAAPGAADRAARFTRVAADLDVAHVVLLSGRGEPAALEGELAVRAVGLPTTVIRSAWFAQNFSEDFLLEAVRGGEIVLPAGSVAEPFIDVEDIAELATAALVDPGHRDHLYEVSGPELLTFADIADELSSATGRPIRYRPVSMADFRAKARADGMPDELVEVYAHLFTETLDGRNSWLADGIERGLGREPRTFASYARTAAASGTWDVVA